MKEWTLETRRPGNQSSHLLVFNQRGREGERDAERLAPSGPGAPGEVLFTVLPKGAGPNDHQLLCTDPTKGLRLIEWKATGSPTLDSRGLVGLPRRAWCVGPVGEEQDLPRRVTADPTHPPHPPVPPEPTPQRRPQAPPPSPPRVRPQLLHNRPVAPPSLGGKGPGRWVSLTSTLLRT